MMTKLKKLTSICLAVIMIFSVMTVAPITVGAAEETGERVSALSGDFEYEQINDQEVCIIGYVGNAADVIIPSEIDGYTVTELVYGAFENCTSVESVTIPDSIERIGDYAFINTAMSGVTIPLTVKEIGEYAFGYSYNEEDIPVKIDGFTVNGYTNSQGYFYAMDNGLDFVSIGEVTPFEYELYSDDTVSISGYIGREANVTIPSEIDGHKVTGIGWGAFSGCESLNSVTVSDGLKEIESYAFSNCTNLESVSLPNTVTKLGAYVFSDCTGLANATLSDNITELGSGVFSDCTNLKSIVIPESAVSVSNNAFNNCTSLKSVIIPSGIVDIQFNAFSNCTSLASVTLPEGLKSVEEYAFAGTAMSSVTIPSSVTSIGECAFGYVYDSDTSEYVKADGFKIYGYAKSGADFYAQDNGFGFVSLGEALPYEYELRDDDTICILRYIGRDTAITVPSEIEGYPVKVIGWGAFENCDTLTSVTIPEGVTAIDGNAFIECTNLKSVIIPNTVTDISYSAFSFCSSLESVTIPDSVTGIGDYAFSYCKSLKSISIPESVIYIGDSAFNDCEKLESVKIPKDVRYIPLNTFSGCKSLASVTLPDNLVSIGEYAFADTALKSVTIPSAVNEIGELALGYVFDENTGEYVKADSFTIYGYTNSESYAYAAYEGFSFVSLGVVSPYEYEIYDENVIIITDYNGSEANLTVPSSIDGYTVKQIGCNAFEKCISLESVIIPDGITNVDEYAFGYCSKLVSVSIPDSVTNIGSFAFFDCGKLGSVNIPNGVTNIYSNTFYGCKNLKSITIPNSVQIIEGYAFADTALSSIAIPQSVTDIGEYAVGYYYDANNECFAATENFTIYGYTNSKADMYARDNGFSFVSVGEVSPFEYDMYDGGVCITKYKGTDAELTIPSELGGYTVLGIGGCAFENCSSLESVTMPDGITYIDRCAFQNCSNLSSVVISNNVTYIDEYAFADCPSLKNVTIPASVNDIGLRSFGYCSDESGENYIKDESFIINGYTNSEGNVYARNNGFTFVSVGVVSPFVYELLEDNTACIYRYRGEYADLTIPSELDGHTVSKIDWCVFENCDTLVSVTMENGINEIGGYAFSNCANLESVTIANSVTYIDSEAFRDCKKLESLTLPDSLENIGDSVFAGTALASVTIPASVTSIGYYAFGYQYNEEEWDYVKVDGFTISGYVGSDAERYATENGFAFSSLGSAVVVILGDANEDGEVAIDDATAIQKYLVGIYDFIDEQLVASDVNKDGVVNVDDVTLIQKYLADLVELK